MSDETILLRTDGTGVWRGDTGLATHDAAGAPTREAVEAEAEQAKRTLALVLDSMKRPVPIRCVYCRAHLAVGMDPMDAAEVARAHVLTCDAGPYVALTKRAEAAESELRAVRTLRDEAAGGPDARLPTWDEVVAATKRAEAAEAALKASRERSTQLLYALTDTRNALRASHIRRNSKRREAAIWRADKAITHAPAGQVPAATQESGEKGPEKAELVPANYLSPWRGFSLCADCRRVLTPDEARAGSLCEGCGGRR